MKWTDEHKSIRETAAKFVDNEINPYVDQWEAEGIFPAHELFKKLGDLGMLGINKPEKYGGLGLDYSYSIVFAEEMGRVRAAGVSTGIGIQTDMSTPALAKFGSEELCNEFLAPAISGDVVTSIAVSEPHAGSDVASIKTEAKKDGDDYVINGTKMWISNSPFADIAVVWAKDENKRIHGLIIERGMAGFTTPETHNKWSLRASSTGELIFDNVRVPKKNILPGKSGLGAPLMCLDSARYGISWGAIGVAMDCYNTALKYSLERVQFGKPIAAKQLQQKKLAEMLTEITKAQLLSWKLGKLKNEDKATSAQISLAKRNNVDMAMNIAREARQVLGGMGITGDFSIMRHMMNLESVITYEGTHDIHLLILGNEITGHNAF